MKIKEGCEASTSEPWYDLNNGYLKPEEILENKEDVKRVYDAIFIVNEFLQSCEEEIEGFYQ